MSRKRAVWRNRRPILRPAVWADINNDGFLDLFVGNETGPSQLFLNKGDGTFEDISHSAGIDRTAFTKGVVAADYDNDGYVDFYVSNQTGANFLYHNNHNGTFTEIASQAGVPGVGKGFRRVVLRLRQRWLARLVCRRAFTHRSRRPCKLTSGFLTKPGP